MLSDDDDCIALQVALLLLLQSRLLKFYGSSVMMTLQAIRIRHGFNVNTEMTLMTDYEL